VLKRANEIICGNNRTFRAAVIGMILLVVLLYAAYVVVLSGIIYVLHNARKRASEREKKVAEYNALPAQQRTLIKFVTTETSNESTV
jgi:cell division protein FtsL